MKKLSPLLIFLSSVACVKQEEAIENLATPSAATETNEISSLADIRKAQPKSPLRATVGFFDAVSEIYSPSEALDGKEVLVGSEKVLFLNPEGLNSQRELDEVRTTKNGQEVDRFTFKHLSPEHFTQHVKDQITQAWQSGQMLVRILEGTTNVDYRYSRYFILRGLPANARVADLATFLKGVEQKKPNDCALSVFPTLNWLEKPLPSEISISMTIAPPNELTRLLMTATQTQTSELSGEDVFNTELPGVQIKKGTPTHEEYEPRIGEPQPNKASVQPYELSGVLAYQLFTKQHPSRESHWVRSSKFKPGWDCSPALKWRSITGEDYWERSCQDSIRSLYDLSVTIGSLCR